MPRLYRTIEFPRGFANEFRIVEHTSTRERDQYIADHPDSCGSNSAYRCPRPITASDARKRGVSEF